MNRNIAIAFVLATATIGSAFAGEITPEPAPFVSTLSRAQVRAELAQYRHDGVDTTSYEYNPLATFKSSTSRGEVAADYIANRDEVAATDAEARGAEAVVQSANARS